MQAIRPTLTLNQQGPDIANLHAVIDYLSYGRNSISQQDRADKRYGEATAEAVKQLQIQNRIVAQPFGEVDQLTADALNKMVFNKGGFHLVEGQVTQQDGNVAAGIVITAYDLDNLAGNSLGLGNTNVDGYYQIYYDPLFYTLPSDGVLKEKQVIDLVVLAYDVNGNVLAQSAPLQDKNTEAFVKIDLILSDITILKPYVIRGQVFEGEDPQSGVSVSVFDRDLFFRRGDPIADQPLGSDWTHKMPSEKNSDGWFEIFYETAVFEKGDVPSKEGDPVPDLIFFLTQDGLQLEKFQIFRIPDSKELLTETLVSDDDLILGFQARKVEEVRIVILESNPIPKPQLTEYELLLLAIEPLLPERAPEGATTIEIEALVGAAVLRFDEVQHRDFTFVARETGFDKTLVGQLQEAFQKTHKNGSVPAWAFFGLASHQISLDNVASMSMEDLVATLKPLQPTFDKSDLASIADSLKAYVKEQNTQAKITDLKTLTTDLIQPILGSDTKYHDFIDAYARYEGATEDFWKEMSQKTEYQNEIPKIQLNLQLSQLTLNNKGLIDSLLQQESISRTRQLVDITSERWDALALEHKASIPAHITGNDDLERSKNYSKELQALVEVAFPTDFIKKNVEHPDVNLFLNINPDFDFTSTPLETFIQAKGDQAFQGITEVEAAKTTLRQMQRLYAVTANAADMKVLMDLNYESAHQLALFPFDDLHQKLNGRISDEFAMSYYVKAQQIDASTKMIFNIMKDQYSGLNITSNATQNKNNNDKKYDAVTLLKGLPNWENLFGSLSTCECRHCQSVYSPAAYFVDLLHILLGKNDGAARKELFRRRPDLKFTKLTCEHTETLIPYIDLVNEVLETYVAQSTLGDAAAESHAKDATNDTSNFTADELAANPQHPNDVSAKDAKDAYDLVKAAIYPLNLPFDRDLEVARQFLQQQNSSRFELMKTFNKASPNAISAERLGISTREFEILTLKQLVSGANTTVTLADGTTRDINASDLWGTPTIPAGQSLGQVLANVKTFIDQANITYSDLIALLNTQVLNPNFPINVHLQSLSNSDKKTWASQFPEENVLAVRVIELGANSNSPCDLNTTQILHINGELLTDEELSLFNRFIRLWKKLDCYITELDGLLVAMGAKDITPQVIQNLSDVWQVQETLELSLEEMAVLIGNIPAAKDDSLFARLFLNKAILQIDPKFALNLAHSEVDDPNEKLVNHVPAILAALQITEKNLNSIVSYVNLNLDTDNLTLKNLSTIYRYVIFAKGLRLKIQDLITWLELIPQSPWNTVAELVTTTELLDKLNRYGFKAADFAFIFQNKKVAGNPLPPKDEIINQSAKSLREGLLKISQENTPNDGLVTADFLKNRLGIVLDTKEISRVIGILDGSNEIDKFDHLENLEVLDNFKSILNDYLIPGVDALNLSNITDIPLRFQTYWEIIKAKLLPVLRKTFVQQHLIATFKVEAAMVPLFLQDTAVMKICLDTENDNPANTQTYLDLYISMYKSLWLIGKLKLSAKEVTYFDGNANFNNFKWNAFTINTWLRIADFVALRNSLPIAEKDLLFVFESAKPTNKVEDIIQAIVEVTAWDKVNIEYVVKNNPNFVKTGSTADFLNELALIELQKQIELSRLIGISLEKLESWSVDTVTDAQARDIKRSLKAKYKETAWIDVSTQVHNRIRIMQRDALVAYLLQKPEIKALDATAFPIKDTNDLYSYFLIDVEMDACMLTSRLVQAIASVQLFVQRCLLNLESLKVKAEQIILPSLIDANQWEWMKNYRVWEANRKVFLYPENWIEPELRDNKSPFFKELESELLQAEVTNDSVEKALMNYLEKMHDVARLDICGTFEDKDGQELHVFGRTFNNPPQYFYRKLDLNTQVWTPWEKVQLDIQGNEGEIHTRTGWSGFDSRLASQSSHDGESSGVHLIPVVWNRGLYLFWPIFTQKSDKAALEWEKAVKIKDNNPWSYWEIKLAWSQYRNNKWSNKKVSHSCFRTRREIEGTSHIYQYRFSLNIDSTLKIKIFYPYVRFVDFENLLTDGGKLTLDRPIIDIDKKDLQLLGEFQFDCNERISILSHFNYIPFDVIKPTQVNFYQSILSAPYDTNSEINWQAADSFALEFSGNNANIILERSEGEYKLLFSSDHNFSSHNHSRFFYQDHMRDYYVEPDWVSYQRVQEFREPYSVKFPSKVKEVAVPLVVPIHPGNPVLAQNVDRFKNVSETTLNQLVTSGSITSSTLLQLNATQTITKSNFLLTDKKSWQLPPKTYLQQHNNAFSYGGVEKLQFKPFFHAYVCRFMEVLSKDGIDGLLKLTNQLYTDIIINEAGNNFLGGLQDVILHFFEAVYIPNKSNVSIPYPVEEVDFSQQGAYGLYNWELFFHIPLLLANRLSKNQRFKEAIRWYHFVFNPTTNDKLNTPARYWQVLPLRNTPTETLQQLFAQLDPKGNASNRKAFEDTITAWRNDPFKPHLIARMRLSAYQKNTFMKYLDNLIAWADTLFSQDTMESVNEATQLYILAAELLGKRPEIIPMRDKIQVLNYQELEDKGIDAFSNVIVDLETIFPFYNLQPVAPGDPNAATILSSTAPSLYFCLPENDKLFGYWDTIADRLFKIRHCQNIEGIERQLALFQPPIDPALLVQAVAGGVDISSVLADLNAPLPYYRFNYILQKALGLCAELKSIGSNLLSALEKNDGEALAMMRTEHETFFLSLAKEVKKLQITEAQRSREGLEKTREVTDIRAQYYAQLLKDGLNSGEKEHQALSFASLSFSLGGQMLEMASSSANTAPDMIVGGMVGLGGGPITINHVGGGGKTAGSLSAFGRFFSMLSSMTSVAANSAQTSAGYERRANDWKFQKDLAEKEQAQIDKQILAAKIREQVAEQELINIVQQFEDASQVQEFYRNKFTQEELYGWMVGEISTIYFQCYQLAYDLAKKAEKTYRWELGIPNSNFIQFGIWDSFRKGLLSGEKLHLSLLQMEKSYMDKHRREFELSKNISLRLHDPLALITLKETGTCNLELPETLFDADYPGHYMRRIKSVSITIPCVAGPYTSVNCTLTLLKSQTRISTKADANTYAEDLIKENPRVVTNYSANESIATSSAQNDSGLFELNFRDERYLPFEGSGVISKWRLDLPETIKQFDYQTISDVVLHIKYTAREGGSTLREAANKSLTAMLKDAQGKLQSRLFSLRHEFPSEWQKLITTADTTGNHSQAFSLDKQRFPIAFRNGTITVKGVDIFGSPKIASENAKDVPVLDNFMFSSPDGAITLQKDVDIGLLRHYASEKDMVPAEIKDLGASKNEADWTIHVNKADVSVSLEKLDDILLVLHYIVELPK